MRRRRLLAAWAPASLWAPLPPRRVRPRQSLSTAVLTWAAFAISVVLLARTWAPIADTYAEYRRIGPRLHLFAAPKPFEGPDGAHQRRALRSWLRLRPRPAVTLLGEGFGGVAREFGVGARTVDHTFLGVPLFHAVLAAANASARPADVVVLLNADVLLFGDFQVALAKLRASLRPPWVALGARWDVDSLAGAIDSPRARTLAVRAVRSAGALHTYGGVDVWAWPRGTLPPLRSRPPPFVFGRGKYDNWFTHELISARAAAVVDISEAVTITHVRHDYHLVASARDAAADANASLPGAFWASDPAEKFELYVNAHIAATQGDFTPQSGTILHAPLKLVLCHRPTTLTVCLLHRRRPHKCRCEHSPFVSRAQSDPFVVDGSRVIFCGLRSADAATGRGPGAAASRWPISGLPHPKAGASPKPVFGLPLTLPDILDVVGNRTADHTLVLVVAMRHEERLLANTVCSAKRTGVFGRLVVAVVDDDMYAFGMLQGFPVYLDSSAVGTPHERRILTEGDHADAEFRATRDLVGFRVLARLISRSLNVVHVRPGAVLTRNVAHYFLSKIEPDVDVAFAVAVYKPSGRKLSSAGVFARGNSKSVALLNQALWLASRTSQSIHTAVDKLACGSFGGPGTSGITCQVGGGVKVKFLGYRDISFLVEGRAAARGGNSIMMLPDDRERQQGKWALLLTHGFVVYDAQLGLCRNPTPDD